MITTLRLHAGANQSSCQWPEKFFAEHYDFTVKLSFDLLNIKCERLHHFNLLDICGNILGTLSNTHLSAAAFVL